MLEMTENLKQDESQQTKNVSSKNIIFWYLR